MCEELEARQLMSASHAAAALIPSDLIAPALAEHKALKHINAAATTNVLPIKITNVAVQNNQLVATGNIGGHTFTTPVTLALAEADAPAGTAAAVAAPAVPILDLSLGPIHLNLLGLKVDTSKICLDIAAQPGNGNLLGNLLAGVANLLNGGTPLGTILGNLNANGTLNQLLTGITNLLNGALGQVTAPTSLAGVTQQAATAAAPAVNILHLSLGPVDLNLLGLTVSLDNCANGPVTVDITAQPGPGNLLGNLLGGLANVLNSHASQQGVLSNLRGVSRQILALL